MCHYCNSVKCERDSCKERVKLGERFWRDVFGWDSGGCSTHLHRTQRNAVTILTGCSTAGIRALSKVRLGERTGVW